MSPVKHDEITEEQIAALKKITTARANNLFTLIDLIGDMDHEGLAFLRRIGDKHDETGEGLRKFFNQVKPETLKFLTEARAEEIAYLRHGTRIVSALILIGSIIKWGVGGFLVFFAGAVMFGEKVSQWLGKIK